MKKLLGLTSLFLTTGLAVFATSITPNYGSFGPLSGATFGGSGIPNDAVAATTKIVNGNDTITLGLTATARYANPTVGNNGAGTFFATPGLNDGLGSPSHDIGTTWNFDWYINLADNTTAGYSFALLYGNNTTGASTLLGFGPASNVSGTAQNSWNLNMGFLNTISFDPNASAIYGFQLEAFDAAGALLGTTAINVQVGQLDEIPGVPDAASTALLLGAGFLTLAVFGFGKNRLALAK